MTPAPAAAGRNTKSAAADARIEEYAKKSKSWSFGKKGPKGHGQRFNSRLKPPGSDLFCKARCTQSPVCGENP